MNHKPLTSSFSRPPSSLIPHPSSLVLTLVAGLLVWLASTRLDGTRLFPDFICYFSAGEILASGGNPYDPALQAAVQRTHGWDRATTGLGVYDFLPYYYPPWFGLAWVLVLPLGYAKAKVLWFFLNVELALRAGYLLRPPVTGVRRWGPVLLSGLSLFCLASTLLGQTAIVVLFLAALASRLLEDGRDRAAGVALAWLTIKPQLTAVLLLAVLIRLARQRRWRALGWFFGTLAALALVSTLLVPSWPIDLLQAPRQTPSPTEHFPWIGNAWFLVLRALGVHGWPHTVLYAAVALPALGAVLWTALRRDGRTLDLMAMGLLAAFFVAPYARHYDFAVLLIPLVALRSRLGRPAARFLSFAWIVVPYVQLVLLTHYKPLYNPSGLFLLEGTFFWVPLLLAAVWLWAAGSVISDQ